MQTTTRLSLPSALLRASAWVLFGALVGTPVSQAQERAGLPTAPHLTLELAQQAAISTLQRCRKDGHAVSVAVADRGGTLIVQLRDPQAGPHTVGSSQGKAFTSASMGQPTARLAEAIAGNPALEGLRDMDQRLVILAGGLPIVIDGQRVGGIGVGGAPGGHLDEACAAAGLQQIGAE